MSSKFFSWTLRPFQGSFFLLIEICQVGNTSFSKNRLNHGSICVWLYNQERSFVIYFVSNFKLFFAVVLHSSLEMDVIISSNQGLLFYCIMIRKICSINLHSIFFLKTTYASKHGLVMLHLSDVVPLPLSCNYKEHQDILQWHYYHKYQYQNLLVNYQ